VKQSPKFSILLPIYNVEKYIDKCIKSILKQSYEDFELICVNDASPDSSVSIVEKYMQNDSRIKLINHEFNKGLGAARNTGLEYATGEILCCVDSDDWLDNDYLLRIKEGFDNNSVKSVWVKHWNYDEDKDSLDVAWKMPVYAHSLTGELQLNSSNIIDYPAYAWNKAYRMDWVKNNNISWIEGMHFEDIYFYFDYYISSPNVYIINEMLYFYRNRENSIVSDSKNFSRNIKDMYSVLEEVAKLIISKQYDKAYINSIIEFGRRFKDQYKRTSCYALVEMCYMSFNNRLKKII
jgi:glycosyltransferase involved in cell wall biosynthesis